MKFCPNCKEMKTLDLFYSRRGGIGNSSYCKECSKDQAVSRQRHLKSLAVEYKGGSCISCGYDRCIGALEFHHRDPTQKDFTLSRRRSLKWCSEIEQELDKCDLLCSNCHREAHDSLSD